MEQSYLTLEEQDVLDCLVRTDHGTVKQNAENCEMVLRLDPTLAGAFALNRFTGRIDVMKDLFRMKAGETLSDDGFICLLSHVDRKYGLVNEKKIRYALTLVAGEREYHPVREALEAIVWDGKKRIREVLHHFLGAPVDEYTETVMKLFLLGAICRVYEPGCKFDYMLSLVGGQGAGKSTFARFLALRDEWFTDDIRKLDDGKIHERLQRHWIAEMSEMLAVNNSKSNEEIKAFLSRTQDTYRVPYSVYPTDWKRQIVFIGTTNRQDFLPLDRTGNRRFLPVIVESDQADTHILADETASRAYICQVWAEAMQIYRAGHFELKFPEHLQPQLLQIQKQCMPDDTLAGLIQTFLDAYKGEYVCSRQLYSEALHCQDEPAKAKIREINDIMNNSVIGWKKSAAEHYLPWYGKQRTWERIEQNAQNIEQSTETFFKMSEADTPFK